MRTVLVYEKVMKQRKKYATTYPYNNKPVASIPVEDDVALRLLDNDEEAMANFFEEELAPRGIANTVVSLMMSSGRGKMEWFIKDWVI